MKRLATAALVSAISTGFAGAASAADLAVKAPLAPVAAYSWSGCYVGGNAGWIGSGNRYDLAPGGNYLSPTGALAPPNGAGTGDFAADIAALTHSYNNSSSGGLIGGQIGCNGQSGRFVYGLEADAQWSGLRSATDATYVAFANLGNAAFTDAAHTEHVSSRLDALATVRGRVGMAFDRLFLYATGGLAIGDVKSDTNVSFGTFPAFPVYNGAVHVGSFSDTRFGWTLGVGGEYAFSPNWSVKVEYLYVDLGSHSYNSPLIAAAAPAAVGPNYFWTTSVHERENIVRVGLNYKWGAIPLVAKY